MFKSQEKCIKALELSFWNVPESLEREENRVPCCPNCEAEFFEDETTYNKSMGLYTCPKCYHTFNNESRYKIKQTRIRVKVEPYCPRCKSKEKTIARKGTPIRYQCKNKNCKSQYNIFTGTPFVYSKIKLPIWFRTFWYMQRGWDEKDIAKKIGKTNRDTEHLVSKIKRLEKTYAYNFLWKVRHNYLNPVKFKFSNSEPYQEIISGRIRYRKIKEIVGFDESGPQYFRRS